MERRLFKRIAYGVKAEIILHGKSIRGVIEDLSEKGANIITDPIEDPSVFIQGKEVELKFRPLDQEAIVLNCKIQWITPAYPNSRIYKIGMELLNPPWDESSCFV
jgi:Tfp pilus assembly protein PilZ